MAPRLFFYSISQSSVHFAAALLPAYRAARLLAVLTVLSPRCSLVNGPSPIHCLRVSILIEKWNYTFLCRFPGPSPSFSPFAPFCRSPWVFLNVLIFNFGRSGVWRVRDGYRTVDHHPLRSLRSRVGRGHLAESRSATVRSAGKRWWLSAPGAAWFPAIGRRGWAQSASIVPTH